MESDRQWCGSTNRSTENGARKYWDFTFPMAFPTGGVSSGLLICAYDNNGSIVASGGSFTTKTITVGGWKTGSWESYTYAGVTPMIIVIGY